MTGRELAIFRTPDGVKATPTFLAVGIDRTGRCLLFSAGSSRSPVILFSPGRAFDGLGDVMKNMRVLVGGRSPQ